MNTQPARRKEVMQAFRCYYGPNSIFWSLGRSFGSAVQPLQLGVLVIISIAMVLSIRPTIEAEEREPGVSVPEPSPPFWWFERGVIDAEEEPHDFAAINQGQLKHVATQAYDELNEHLSDQNRPQQLEDLIVDWGNPGSEVDDFRAVNLGQAKFVAALFYDWLIAEDEAEEYPWDGIEEPEDDYSLANIGQIKWLFNFDLIYPKTIVTQNPSTGDTTAFTLSANEAIGYSVWIACFQYADPPIPSGEMGYLDDPSNDQIPNIMKYVFGAFPNVATTLEVYPESASKTIDGVDYYGMRFYIPEYVLDPEQEVSPHIPLDDLQGFAMEATDDLVNEPWRYVCDPILFIEDTNDQVELPEDPGCDEIIVENDYYYKRVSMLYPEGDPTENRFFRMRLMLGYTGDFIQNSFANALLHKILDQDNSGISFPDDSVTADFGGTPFMADCFDVEIFEDGVDPGIEFDRGVIMTTGLASAWSDNSENASHTSREISAEEPPVPGDDDLQDEMDAQVFNSTFEEFESKNAAFLAFDFTPDKPVVELEFIFASEEYYVPGGEIGGVGFNDAMAIFIAEYELVEGELELGEWINIAVLSDTETDTDVISVFNVGTVVNPAYVGSEVNNNLESNSITNFFVNSSDEEFYDTVPEELPPFGIVYSGFTRGFLASSESIDGGLDTGELYRMKIVVSDSNDTAHDSAIFLKEDSLRALDP